MSNKTQSDKRKSRRWALLLILAIGSGTVATYFAINQFHVPSIERDARQLLTAALSGDAKTVFQLSRDYEKEQAEITEAQFVEMWERLIAPRMEQFAQEGPLESEYYGDHQAVSWTVLSDELGNEYEISAAPMELGVGTGREYLFKYLRAAWQLEYLVSKGKPVTSESTTHAYIEGLTADKSTLLALGIEGMPSRTKVSTTLTWDELLAAWRKRILEIRSGKYGDLSSGSKIRSKRA